MAWYVCGQLKIRIRLTQPDFAVAVSELGAYCILITTLCRCVSVCSQHTNLRSIIPTQSRRAVIVEKYNAC